ncbi:MAG: thiamine diphosphokinase [Treponema sp.]|nr:thiamine diphosphokinase [Treponema sp.]
MFSIDFPAGLKYNTYIRYVHGLCLCNEKGIVLLGIIFTGGGKPCAQVIRQAIDKDAMADNVIYIAADSGLEVAENAGLRPHWIIGDMDSINDISSLAYYPPDCVKRYPQDKDYTDTELAFSLAVEKGCDTVWIIGGGGGRIDHLFGIRSLFERDIFPVRWITGGEDIHCISACNAHNKLSLKPGKNACVSVFPLGNGPWEAQSSGLKWPLSGLPWDRGFFGLSNVASDGDFSIKAEAGRFMVILEKNLQDLCDN